MLRSTEKIFLFFEDGKIDPPGFWSFGEEGGVQRNEILCVMGEREVP